MSGRDGGTNTNKIAMARSQRDVDVSSDDLVMTGGVMRTGWY